MSIKELDRLVKSAEDLCEEEKYQDAISISEELVKRWPDNMLSNYILGRAKWGISALDEALYYLDKAIKLNPDSSKAWNYKGNVLLEMKREEDALVCYDRAIDINPEYARAYYNKGSALNDLKRYEEAIECFDRAINIDPNNADVFFNKGCTLHEMKRYEEALACFYFALRINPKDADIYNALGTVYSKTKQFKEAETYFSEALDLNPSSVYFANRANLYLVQNDYIKAEVDIKKAADIDPTNAYVQYFLSKINNSEHALQEPIAFATDSIPTRQSNSYRAVERFIAEEEKAEEFSDNPRNELDDDLVNRIQNFHSDERQRLLEKTIEDNTDSFKRFTSVQRTPDNLDKYEFYVLRRWNSYTPIVSHNNGASKGGGYFLHTGESGVVIDPGFNFIDNFQECGFKFSQIRKVFITHAHNDHDADLESILTLLYVYNKDIKRSIVEDICKEVLNGSNPSMNNSSEEDIYKYLKKEKSARFFKERKVIDIYLTCGAFKKHSARLDLRRDGDYRVHIINANDREIQITKDTTIRAIRAKHFDLMSDCDAVGFVIEFPASVIVYTGDTGFSADIRKQYRELREEFAAKKKVVTLLAHLGGFKPRERNTNPVDLASGKSFYKDHLGRNGLICLVNELRPSACILSEFGEEFNRYRIKVTNLFAKAFKDLKIPFVPADIGLCINSEYKVWAVSKTKYGRRIKPVIEREFHDPASVRAIEISNRSLSYFQYSLIKNKGDLNRLRVDIERASESALEQRPQHPPTP